MSLHISLKRTASNLESYGQPFLRVNLKKVMSFAEDLMLQVLVLVTDQETGLFGWTCCSVVGTRLLLLTANMKNWAYMTASIKKMLESTVASQVIKKKFDHNLS